MHFLIGRECINGENHTTQGDCRAIVPVFISESRSAQVGRHAVDFDVVFQTRVRVFDNGIKAQESNETQGTKNREIHCFECFVTMINHAERVF